MADIERLTITLPSDMADLAKQAVVDGDYASNCEVIREALRDWTMKRAMPLQELDALRTDIAHGLADLAAGRVREFDAARVVARGKKRLAGRSRSA